MAYPKTIALDEADLGDIQAILMGLCEYARWNYQERGHELDLKAWEKAKKGEEKAWEMRARHLPGGKFYEEENG